MLPRQQKNVTVFAPPASTPTFAEPKEPSAIVKDNYASITIRTTPEEAQKVIEWIDQFQKNPGDYNLWTNSCSSVCIEGLKVLGIDISHGLLTDDPDDVWDQLFQKFAVTPTFNTLGHYPAESAKEYGFQRYPGIDTIQLARLYWGLWFYQNTKPLKPCVTTTDSASGTSVTTCE